MTETEFQLVRAAAFAVAVTSAATLQWLRPHVDRRGSWRVNSGLWALNALVVGVVCGGCACTVALWAERRGFGLLGSPGLPSWLVVPAGILALDLVSYCWHRANHMVALLWRFHRVHHADPTFTVSTAVRFHPGELLLSLPVRLSAVALLGVPIAAVASFEIAFTIANLIEHGNIDLPRSLERRLERVFITPALHRRHHSLELDELNSNFGTIFSWWDRMLGTRTASSSDEHFPTGLAGFARGTTLAEALRLPLARGR